MRIGTRSYAALAAAGALGVTAATVAPTLASAAGKTKCTVDVTQLTAPVKVSGTPPLPGSSQTRAGTTDGKVCGRAFHGAFRGVITFTAPFHNTTVGTIFGPLGSVREAAHVVATPHPDGSVSLTGSGKVTGGTGLYKGATGSFSLTGTFPPGSSINTVHITGTIKF